MLFKTGDCVVHPAYGVGTVDRLEEKRFTGSETRLYYKVDLSNGTVWVPIETENVCSLRPVTTKTDLARYRKLLKKQPADLNPNHRERHVELVQRLRSGTLQVFCEIVRDLTAMSWKKSLNEADVALLRKAREALCQEWAVAKGVSLADADRELEALLLEVRQAYSM
jgi:RNA polymerase-interacting CarD/CdnL/TRCF family regulator